MSAKRLTYLLVNLATTIFSIAFAFTYFFVVPDLHQETMSNGAASAFIAWLSTAVFFVFFSLFGIVWNYSKMLRAQVNKFAAPLDSPNSFYIFKNESLNNSVTVARRYFLTFFAALFIAFFSMVPWAFLISLYAKGE